MTFKYVMKHAKIKPSTKAFLVLILIVTLFNIALAATTCGNSARPGDLFCSTVPCSSRLDFGCYPCMGTPPVIVRDLPMEGEL